MGNCVSSQEDIRQANKVQPLSMYNFAYLALFAILLGLGILMVYLITRIKMCKKVRQSQILNQVQIKSQMLVRIIRNKDGVRVAQNKEELKQFSNQPEACELLKIQRSFHKYSLETHSKQSKAEDQEGLSDSCAWIVVKSSKSQLTDGQGYDLKEGDYVKLGRVRFRIREVRITPTQDTTQVPELQKFVSQRCLNVMTINTDEDEVKSQTDEPQCRICYNDSITNADNPLIDCCKCQGSVRYIHIQCLQTWLASKLQPKTTKFSVSFQWKQFECEVCKALIPSRIKYQDRIYETIVIPKPEVPYITLEILSRDRNQSKGTHIISFAQKPMIKLGRGHESDVRITDISVSRCHAIIKFHNSGFILEDQQSKFGTLVLMKDQNFLTLELNNNLALQIGRSVISFQISKEWNVQNCCMGGPIENDEAIKEEENDLIGNGIGDEEQQLDQLMQVEEEQSPA